MGNLLTSLLNSTNALGVFSQALQIIGNNVTNATTPGYVKQSLSLEALPFDVSVGLPGGVAAGSIESSRNAFAEQNVRDQQSGLGSFQQKAAALSTIENQFDLSGKTGVGGSLNALFQSFSQLSIAPNDAAARQNVLNQAGTVAQSFRHTAASLAATSSQTTDDARYAITQVNRLAATISQINGQHIKDYKGNTDAGLDARLNASLEDLSQYVNFSALQQPDGSVTVYLGGQTPLVQGSHALPIQGDFSTPQARILDSQGQDITSQITQGRLSGLLDVRNNKIPSYINDLNTLAAGVADRVNSTLANGIDQNGAAPATDLFAYSPTNGAAQTLGVNNLTLDQIAAALPGAPSGNGNALNLSALGSAKPLQGYTFTQFYGNLAGRVGQDIADSRDGKDTQTQLLQQAQTLRSQSSSVNLDEEAAKLIQFQRSYQAAAKLVTVLDQLTLTAINMIP